MPRTIAYLTSLYARAGDTFIRREVEELRRRGWVVHTFSIRRPDAAEAVSEEIRREQASTDYILEHGAWRLLASFVRCALRAPRRMLRAVRQASALRWPGLRSWIWHLVYLLEASYLAEQLRRKGVVHLHDHIAMNSATVAMLASTLSAVPFSFTVHGLELLEAQRWALGKKLEAARMTVCISSHGRAQCMMFSAPAHWSRIHEVRCGLEAAALQAPRSDPPDRPRLACVGRLSPEKGQLVLLQAVAALRDQGIDVEVDLVGDGPDRGEVERLARSLGVADRVQVLGWRGSAEVQRVLEDSRALVVPSFSEGIPVVIMEALALARPVVASCVGGIPELVRPGENGWLVAPGSVEELAGAMREAVAAAVPELRRMGERGRERVLARHSLAVEVGRLGELFERAVGGDAARTPVAVAATEGSTAATAAPVPVPGAASRPAGS